MSFKEIFECIEAIESQTQRSLFLLYGSPKKLTHYAIKSSLNKIGAFQYDHLKNAVNDFANLNKFKFQSHCDLILSSPGGKAAMAIAYQDLLRKKFGGVNVLVPTMAGSAAALMGFSGSSLYLGDKAQTSDFCSEHLDLSSNTVIAYFKEIKASLSRGSIVQPTEIDAFIALNNMLAQSKNHAPIPYSNLLDDCNKAGIELNTKKIADFDSHDPEFKTTGVSQLILDLDQKVRDHMKANSLATFVASSKVSNLGLN